MNIWEGAKNNCRIINELRQLDSEIASLAFMSRELCAMHVRLSRLIETFYKLDTGENPGGMTEEQADEDYKKAFNTATRVRAKAKIDISHINKIFSEWGFKLEPGTSIVPLVNHIQAETASE